MGSIDLDLMRHLLLRFSLAFILVWFGIQQVISPGDWTGFIPMSVAGHSPISPAGMILVHGALLTLSAFGIALGLFPKSSSVLASILLIEIIAVLFLKGGSGGLIVRDVGLLVMAIVLAFDHILIPWLKFPKLISRGGHTQETSMSFPL